MTNSRNTNESSKGFQNISEDFDVLAKRAEALVTAARKIQKNTENYISDSSETPVTPSADPVSSSYQAEIPKKKRKRKPKPLFYIIAAILILSIFLVISLIIRHLSGISSQTSLENVTEISGSDAGTQEDSADTAEESFSEMSVTEGYLKVLDNSRDYSLSDTLAFVKSINDITQNYLKNAVNEVLAYQRDQTRDISKDLAVLSAMLDCDLETVSTYIPMFAMYGGEKYIENARDRLENVRQFYEAICRDYGEVAEMVTTANSYIEKENEFARSAKENLITYLEANQVSYHIDDDQITYDEMQFIS